MGFKKRVLQARAINLLHCICVSGYHHHHHHYHYYCISTQETSIIKRALIGLAWVAWAGNYLITGRASSTFLLSPLLPPPPPPPQTKQNNNNKKTGAWLALLWNVYAWVKARKETGGDGPGAAEMKVCPCYTDSSIMSSKMCKSRYLRKFNGMMQNWL